MFINHILYEGGCIINLFIINNQVYSVMYDTKGNLLSIILPNEE